MEDYHLTEDACLEKSASDLLRSFRRDRISAEYLQEPEVTGSSSSDSESEHDDRRPLVTHDSREDGSGEGGGGRRGKRRRRKRKAKSLSKTDYEEDGAKAQALCGFRSYQDGAKAQALCGFRGWRPACLQPLASVYTFVSLVGLSYFMSGMAIKSLFAQVVSIERQFNIDSSHSGLFGSAWHLGYSSTILLVGHFARVTHIPLAIGLAGIVNGLLVMAPSFLELYAPYKLSQFDEYNTSDPTAERHANQNHQYLCKMPSQHTFTSMFSSENSSYFQNNTTQFLENATAFISSTTSFLENVTAYGINTTSIFSSGNLSFSELELSVESTSGQSGPLEVGNSKVAPYAYQLLLWSLMLQGAINSFRYGALPYVYVDDNVLDKTKTGTYLAISFVFAELTGPVGDLINGVFSNIPVDLSGKPTVYCVSGIGLALGQTCLARIMAAALAFKWGRSPAPDGPH
ncbi:hypothetical protein EGW08_011087 [Elysia chlorotica]|uniref:Major facilitator superfamily (MFS) profile domain-containing protein n=1 Tax=Elysia chlorotica TaxID=188477 RepID=A0A3S1HK68_ELYCH|nr:hypothetical protein EGW08_011087 [Elysia chlorotica]